MSYHIELCVETKDVRMGTFLSSHFLERFLCGVFQPSQASQDKYWLTLSASGGDSRLRGFGDPTSTSIASSSCAVSVTGKMGHTLIFPSSPPVTMVWCCTREKMSENGQVAL